MRLGIFAMLAAAFVWTASLFGFLIETARWVPHAAGGGLLLLIIGSQIFFRRTSGVRLPPSKTPHEQPKYRR
ncbi:MAG TPA: hypothetical protein PLB55_23885 [Prosthecobacter sp.]|nr:hypothetical protein [Prosthecobacter sp.]